MRGLVVHALLGLATVVLFLRANAHLYRRDWPGSATTPMEGFCYAMAALSVVVGWYFNTVYMFEYPAEGSWTHFIAMMFDNPAGGSVGQDIVVTNAVLFPLWTIVDGTRRGMKIPWIYFVMSLFTSFGFAMGLFLAAQERQLRWTAAAR